MKQPPAPHDLITEEDFNQMVARRGLQPPSEDSFGDSGTAQALEIEMGEQFPNVSNEALEEIEQNDSSVGENGDAAEKMLTDPAGRTPREPGASTWPDLSELDDVPMTSAIPIQKDLNGSLADDVAS